MVLDKLQCGAALVLCSIIEMWAAAVYCDGHTYTETWNNVQYTLPKTTSKCEGMWAWAVAVGVISLVFSAAHVVLVKFKPDMAEGMVGYAIATFLFLLWVCGAAVCTYWKPFAPGPGGGDRYGIAGNGYFATWGGVVFSAMLVIQIPPVTDLLSKFFGSIDHTKKLLLALFATSMVEMWHAAEVCDDDSHCEGMLAWGVAAGVVSVTICLVWGIVSHFVPNLAAHTKFIAIFLAAWWLSAVLSLTMPNNASNCGNDTYCQGLFLEVSNGFIGTWGSLGLAVWLTADSWGFALEDKEGEEATAEQPADAATPAYVDAVKPPESEEPASPDTPPASGPVAAPADVTLSETPKDIPPPPAPPADDAVVEVPPPAPAASPKPPPPRY